MAVIHKRKRRQGRAQLKVRLPEDLRREIEHAAARGNHSMNTEIVRRLMLFTAWARLQRISHLVEETGQPELIRRPAAAPTDEARPDVYYDDLTEEILGELSGLGAFVDDLSDKIRRLVKPAKSHTEATPAEVKK
jgi:Arc-like DNA binding domain